MVVFFLLAAALLASPTRSSSSSSNGAGLQQPTATFCSGHSPAVTGSDVTGRFLAAVCAGAYGVAHMRLSCMARYESYPFYNTKSLPRRLLAADMGSHEPIRGRNPTPAQAGAPPPAASRTVTVPVSAQPTSPPPPGGRTRNPPPAQAGAPPPAASRTGAAQPTPAPPHGGHTHTPLPAAAAPNDQTRTVTRSSGKETSNTSKRLIVSIATGLASIAAIVVLALTVWYHRKRRPVQRGHVIDVIFERSQADVMPEETMHGQENRHLSTEEDEEDDRGRTSCQLYSYQVLEAATCRFSSRNKLGSGGFGTVYKGTLENGEEVAVKRLRDSKRTVQELEKEISIVVNLCHENLVKFLGYCFQEEGMFLIYEYVPNNSLDKFWYKASLQGEKLEWATWFNIILGVARGLRFLHDKGIIHRDLKPHNVLLDDNFNPKIADFDLMKMYDKQKTHESTEKVVGTFGYMAPECTSGRKFLPSVKSDVYSYGVLVLEIITGHKIYTFEGQHSEGLVEYVWQHWTEKRASDVVDSDLGVEGQEHAARQALRCVHIALLCVQSDRARRPTMGQVIAMLMSNGDDGAELPEPSLPGYIVRPTAASGAQLCFGCR